MILLKRQRLINLFTQVTFYRKNTAGVNPLILQILGNANVSESIYSQNMLIIGETQNTKNVISFHNQIKNKFQKEHLPLILMDTFSHASNVIADREYIKLVTQYIEKLSTPQELFVGLKVLNSLKKFKASQKLKLSKQCNLATQKMFYKVLNVVDQLKQNFSYICQLVPIAVQFNCYPRKLISFIEEYIKSSDSKEYLTERYFILFLKAYSQYPSHIISKHKAIESIAIQPLSTKIINHCISSYQEKLEIMAAIAKLGYQVRGNFLRTPTCFDILKQINVEHLKISSLCYVFQIASHIPKSYLKMKQDAIKQFIKLTYSQSLNRMLEILSNVEIQKLQNVHLEPIYPHLITGMHNQYLSTTDLSNCCCYFFDVKSVIPTFFCQEIHNSVLNIKNLNAISDYQFVDIVNVLKFLVRHSKFDLKQLLNVCIDFCQTRKLGRYEDRTVLAFMDLLFCIQRFSTQTNFDGDHTKICQLLVQNILEHIKNASSQFLLKVDQKFLYAPYEFAGIIQEKLLQRIVSQWKTYSNLIKCQIIIFYSVFQAQLRSVLYEQFDIQRIKNRQLNNLIYEVYVHLPDRRLPKLKRTYLSSQKILEIMTDDPHLSNNKIARFLFTSPVKTMVMKSGILSKSYYNLIGRIDMQDFKNVNIDWLIQSILKLNQFVSLQDSKLVKLFCNFLFKKIKNKDEDHYSLLTQYFKIVGNFRNSHKFVHITELAISSLENNINNNLANNSAKHLPQILSILLSINMLPQPYILQQCKDLIKSNYKPQTISNLAKWQLLMLHLNEVLTFDSLFFEQLYYQMEQIIRNNKMNIFTLIKYVQMFDINSFKNNSSEISTLYSNFALNVLNKQTNLSVQILLKLYKIAHIFKIQDYRNSLLDVITKRKLDDNDLLHIIQCIQNIDDRNTTLINKVISTCVEHLDTLYPKIKIMVINTLLRMNYSLNEEVQQFILTMLKNTEDKFVGLQDITRSDVTQKIGYKMQFLWVMLIMNKTDGKLFQLLKKIFLEESMTKIQDVNDNNEKWKILQCYFLLDTKDMIPYNYKSKFLSMKRQWMIQFKANIPKDIKGLLSRQKGWKLYPQVSGYKIMAYNSEKKIAVVNMGHRMLRPLTGLETGYSKSRDIIIKHYFNDPKIVKIDFQNYDLITVREQLQ